MHKFIIVGHPQSGYQEVENLLHECGMGKAKPSRREGLLPDQISETLRQAHGTPALAALTAAEQVEQIGTAPVWHGMAMDLMLGNLDQRFWGWSDPGAIHLLEYWKQLDPTINFVFVYADPQSALVGPDADDALSVEAKLSNWQAFNAAMLHFYNRNPKRSVLVQAEQVRHSVRAYLQQLRTQLNAPLSEPPAHLVLAGDMDTIERDAEPAPEAGKTPAIDEATALPVEACAEVVGLAEAGPGEVVDEAALPRFLARHCVAQHPEAGQLYEELQAVANLPLEPAMQAGPAAEAAWVALLMNTRRSERQKLMLREQEVQLASLQQQAEESRAALEHIAQDVERKQKALSDFEAKTAELAQEAERLRAAVAEQAEVKEENDLLLTQLHQVQEELERTFLEKASLDSTLSAAKASERSALEKLQAVEKAEKDGASRLAALKHEIEAVRAEGGQLKDALAKKTTEQQDTLEENDLLLTQLHSVQEELERLFHARTDNEKALALAQSSEGAIRQKLDALQVEEAKLKDALGKKTAEHGETLEENELLLTQLHAVQEELERTFLEKESLKKTLAATKGDERAALDKLRAAEKAKKDGATRLTALKRELEAVHAAETKLKAAVDKKTAEQKKTQNENRRLLSQLQVVQEELERRHAEIQHLKKTMVPRDPPLYGAAERVKQQLTYRLGATMIEKSKSVGGWFSMPFALMGTARQFRAEQRAMGGKKLPPIFKYKDADQAERVKQHLSYRVGTVLLRNVKSPIGWARLPFALRREIKAFRLERQKGRAND